MTTYQEQKNFTFVSDACPEETFDVVRFKGTERISGLYEFDITLASDDPDIDVRSVLQNPATFRIVTPDAELPVYGIMARFEQLQEVDDHVFYRGILVPRLWQATLARDNELFLEKNVRDIIEDILVQTGLTSSDYDIRLTADYSVWEYICQYQESDFSFVARRMEREGIYYYFEQTENGDKLIVTDSSTSHANIPGQATMNYITPSGFAPPEEDAVRSFICRHQILPARVVLKDYNYRRPTLDLRGEADVDAAGGRGTVYIYGEHFKTTEEGNALARVRAEELLSREQVFYGESTAAHLRPGYIFELAGHYRDSYNQRYLVLDVSHKGRQTRFLSQGALEEGVSGEEGPGYVNQFSAIPADVQFRPERKTQRPRINGTMNATIDSAGDGQYAEIDDEGRYKVVLPFDQSGNSEGRASRWCRMAQPYAGANYGMHFPLHKGTEVLLTFIDGDPDRPIISGSVPNPDTMSPVTGGNQTKSVIRTGGGNQIAIEDSNGGQQIHLSSPTEGSVISLGAPNEGNLFFKTMGDYVQKVHGPETRMTNGKVYVKHGSNYKYECGGGAEITYKDNVVSKTVGTTTEDFIGAKKSTMHGTSHETFVGVKTSESLAATFETFVGYKKSENLAATDELFIGVKNSVCAALSMEAFGGLKVSLATGASIEKSSAVNLSEAPVNEIKGNAGVKITCGGSSIVMTPGSIKIQSPSVLIASSGGMVRMNGSVTIGGRAAFTDNVVMDEKLKVNGNFENPSIKAST